MNPVSSLPRFPLREKQPQSRFCKLDRPGGQAPCPAGACRSREASHRWFWLHHPPPRRTGRGISAKNRSRSGGAVPWRRPDEPESRVGLCRFIIDGVRQHCADAGLLSDQKRSPDRILQQAKADSAPLVVPRNRQSGQNNHRKRILTHPFAKALGHIERINLADGQAEHCGSLLTLDPLERKPR